MQKPITNEAEYETYIVHKTGDNGVIGITGYSLPHGRAVEAFMKDFPSTEPIAVLGGLEAIARLTA